MKKLKNQKGKRRMQTKIANTAIQKIEVMIQITIITKQATQRCHQTPKDTMMQVEIVGSELRSQIVMEYHSLREIAQIIIIIMSSINIDKIMNNLNSNRYQIRIWILK